MFQKSSVTMRPAYEHILPTAMEGNVFTGVCQSFCPQSTSWLLGHCSSMLATRSLLRRAQYESYRNAFLL